MNERGPRKLTYRERMEAMFEVIETRLDSMIAASSSIPEERAAIEVLIDFGHLMQIALGDDGVIREIKLPIGSLRFDDETLRQVLREGETDQPQIVDVKDGRPVRARIGNVRSVPLNVSALFKAGGVA